MGSVFYIHLAIAVFGLGAQKVSKPSSRQETGAFHGMFIDRFKVFLLPVIDRIFWQDLPARNSPLPWAIKGALGSLQVARMRLGLRTKPTCMFVLRCESD